MLREVQCSVLELPVRGAAVLEHAGPRVPELHSMLDWAVSGFSLLLFERPCLRSVHGLRRGRICFPDLLECVGQSMPGVPSLRGRSEIHAADRWRRVIRVGVLCAVQRVFEWAV